MSGLCSSAWKATRRPKDLVEGTRWLFAVAVLAALAITIPAPLAAGNPTTLALLAGSSLALIASWLYGYARRRAPVDLDVVDAVAIAALALACPDPALMFGCAFTSLWFRSLYGSGARAILRGVLYAAAITATIPLWTLIPGHTAAPVSAVLGPLPIMLVTVVVGRQLAIGLFAREQSGLRDAALAAVGTRLLGLTDAGRIVEQAWVAMTEICATAPGLRVLSASRDGAVLRIDRVAGEFSTAPASLPAEIVPTGVDRTGPEQVTEDAPLNAVVRRSCVWLCLPVPDQGDDIVVFLGAPGKVPGEVLLTIRSLINQVALALRNSEAHGQLTTQARTDALTGLANRTSFAAALADALAADASPAAVMFIDLDDFKNVNDALGHAAGDELLRQVAVRLLAVTRPGDLRARLGGDEFAVLLPDASGAVAEGVAERLVEVLAVPVRLDGHVAQVSASVGVAYSDTAMDPETLVQHADIAMYAAKAKGKNRVQVFEPGLLQSDGQPSFDSQLAAAAHAGQIVVFYQPILSLPEGRCTAVEALVRWQHPDRGLLLPAEFIQAAERTGAIVDIGAFVLRRACADVAAWRGAYPDLPLAVHVNVSGAQLNDDHFVTLVAQCLTEFALPPKQLVLEITETIVIASPAIVERLDQLVALGAAIALDDFGTGYSALTMLRALPIDIVKIDRSFVAGSAANPADQAIIEAVIQMATRLGLRTVAEGVERLDQQEFLRIAGADSVQGFLHLRPAPREEFTTWLEAHRSGLRQADERSLGVLPLFPIRTG